MLKPSAQIPTPLDIPNVIVIEVTTDENGAWQIKVETSLLVCLFAQSEN